jgi:hypothetical protein
MYLKRKINISIPIIVWGESYFRFFEENFYVLIKKEFEDEKFIYKKYNINFDIWTEKKFNRKFKIKNIKTKFISIDKYILNNNKYDIIKKIQKKIFEYYKKTDKILFLYPDFIWKNGSILNLLKLDHDIINVYCPQIIKENYLKNKFFIKNFEKFVANNLHAVVKNTIINDKKKNFFTGATNLYQLSNKGYLFKNFHLHPILINKPNFNNVNFNISLDEDFYHNYIIMNNIKSKNIFYQKNAKKICFASVESERNLSNVNGSNKSLINISSWFINNCTFVHLNNSLNTFLLNCTYKKSLKEVKKFNKIFNKIYKKINIVDNNKIRVKDFVIKRLNKRLFYLKGIYS